MNHSRCLLHNLFIPLGLFLNQDIVPKFMPKLLPSGWINGITGSLLVMFLLPSLAISQSIPIGSVEDEQLRIYSLTQDSIGISTVNRPLSRYSYNRVMGIYQKEGRAGDGWWTQPIKPLEQKLPYGFRAGLHPVTLMNTVNTRFPHSENNGAAWYGRGSNIEFIGGFYITSPYLTIDFQPHIIYQQNRDYLIPRFERTINRGSVDYRSLTGRNRDVPYRFGPDPFTTMDAGYSSITAHYRWLEAGWSNVPVSWGPVRHYPLGVSHNAPGFPHGYIGTREKVRIPHFGGLQFRWMAGYPQESDYYNHSNSGRTRFANMLNVAWSPAYIDGLTVGLTRVYHMYEDDGFNWDNVFVMFDPFAQADLVEQQGGREERQQRNQAATVYAEWVIPTAGARIYAELFREDHSWDMRDFINQPHHNSAWTIGFEKLFKLPGLDMLIFNTEFNSLTMTQLQQVRPQVYFYGHSQVTHGHTNRGQVLGAAIGPGSNSQLIQIDAYRNRWQAGLKVQRMVDNDNFHFNINSYRDTPSANFGDYFRHRVNLNIGGEFQYRFGPMQLHYRMLWTKAYNYGRFDYGQLDRINVTNYERNDRNNLQIQMGVRYGF